MACIECMQQQQLSQVNFKPNHRYLWWQSVARPATRCRACVLCLAGAPLSALGGLPACRQHYTDGIGASS